MRTFYFNLKAPIRFDRKPVKVFEIPIHSILNIKYLKIIIIYLLNGMNKMKFYFIIVSFPLVLILNKQGGNLFMNATVPCT